MKTNSLDRTDIPEGCYCYTYENGEFKRCPYWSLDNRQPKQDNGFCKFLNKGDWELGGISLLWDQVKECGINIGDKE